MSADNTIFVQRQLDGFWQVWMGLCPDDKQKGKSEGAGGFITEKEALIYAEGWLRGESVVEHGIRMLAAQTEEKKCLKTEYTNAKCPHCGKTIWLDLYVYPAVEK